MNRRDALLVLFALGVAAGPFAASAQPAGDQAARIGLLVTGSAAQRGHLERALLEGLRERGFIEGRNLILERRYADGGRDRVPEFARELAAMKLDAVVTTCTPTTRAAKEAIDSTPIVMAAVADPVGQRLIASLAKPGANVTGLSSQAEDILPKMMELFASVLRRRATVAVFVQGGSAVHPRMWQQLAPVGQTLGLTLKRIDVADPKGLPAAFDQAKRENADALFFLPDEPMFLTHRTRIVELAALHRLPAFYGAKEFVDAGGLMSYGESLPAAYRSTASYISNLIRGAKPGDLPVEQPTRFELAVNLNTAKALGISIPQSILLGADSIVR